MKQQVNVLSNIDAVVRSSKLRHIINENSTVGRLSSLKHLTSYIQ